MSDLKDQNHIFPEPEIDSSKKTGYRPVLADDSAIFGGAKEVPKERIIINNPNVSFKGVIKDISNTNLETLAHIKQEDEQERMTAEEPIIINPDATKYTQQAPEDKKNVVTFKAKLPFGQTKLGKFLKKFWWLVSIFAILFGSLLYFGITQYLDANKSTPIIKNVDFNITGPDTAAKSTLKIWTITVTNNDKFNLKDLVLEMNYDRDFGLSKSFGDFNKNTENNKLFTLDSLKTGEKKILNLEGKLETQVDVSTKMNGKLRFTVDSTDFKNQKVQELQSADKLTKVEKSVIRIDITSDSRVPKESDQDVKVDFTNQSGKPLTNFRLKMTYPTIGSNFIYVGSEFFLPGKTKQTTPSVGDHTWNIPNLDAGQTGTLLLKTKMKGLAGDKLILIAELINSDDNAVLNKAEKEIVVVDKALSLKPLINVGGDYINAEGTINYSVTIKNNYTTDLKNLKVTASFIDNADLIDKEGFGIDQGSPILDKNKKEVSWTGSGLISLQRLGPKAEETITFTGKIKPLSAFTASTFTQENFFIQPKVTVTGDNFEPQSEVGDIRRAKGGPELKQSVEYLTDGAKKIAKVTWEIKNQFSGLKGVEIRSRTPLPSTAWNQASITPTGFSPNIVYTKDNGQIVWKVGDVKPYTGYNGQEVKITFTLINETDSKINFSETPTYTATDTLNQGYEFNQINTPIKDGGAVTFQ
jgi:hypothetical protein